MSSLQVKVMTQFNIMMRAFITWLLTCTQFSASKVFNGKLIFFVSLCLVEAAALQSVRSHKLFNNFSSRSFFHCYSSSFYLFFLLSQVRLWQTRSSTRCLKFIASIWFMVKNSSVFGRNKTGERIGKRKISQSVFFLLFFQTFPSQLLLNLKHNNIV